MPSAFSPLDTSLFAPPALPLPATDGGALATRLAGKYLERVTGHFLLPGREGAYAELPAELPDALASALRARGVSRSTRRRRSPFCQIERMFDHIRHMCILPRTPAA